MKIKYKDMTGDKCAYMRIKFWLLLFFLIMLCTTYTNSTMTKSVVHPKDSEITVYDRCFEYRNLKICWHTNVSNCSKESK